MEPVWSCGPILPPSLIDLLEETVQEIENHKEDEDDLDYEELFNDDEQIIKLRLQTDVTSCV